MWIGVRVVVMPPTTQGRPRRHPAELQAIVDSIQIEP